jgi:UDP-N-acetylglucosamine acyltransferase
VLSALRVAYKKLFLRKDRNLADCINELSATEAAHIPQVAHLIDFIKTSERGVTR